MQNYLYFILVITNESFIHRYFEIMKFLPVILVIPVNYKKANIHQFQSSLLLIIGIIYTRLMYLSAIFYHHNLNKIFYHILNDRKLINILNVLLAL